MVVPLLVVNPYLITPNSIKMDAAVASLILVPTARRISGNVPTAQLKAQPGRRCPSGVGLERPQRFNPAGFRARRTRLLRCLSVDRCL